MTAVRRILLVGWSAADWRFLDPMLDARSLPHLAQLIEKGARGNLRTLQPQFTPLLWTSLATGHRADRHGVLTALSPDPGRGTKPVSALDRQCQALWDIAGQRKSRSIIVNWPATYPAQALLGACVSDVFFRLAGDEDGLDPPARDATSPPDLAGSIGDLRFSPAELTIEEMAYFVNDPVAAQEEGDPLLSRLAVSVAETITTHAVAMELTAGDDWQLAMVRYEILDALGAEFMACHPPQLPYTQDRLFDRYGNTIPAVCSYLDLMLGALVEQAGPDTLLVFVSERGLHSDHLRPQDPDTAFHQFGGAPWFREQGVLAMAGPGVAAGARVQGASLLDIAPTILRCMGAPPGDGMPGRILVEAFDELPDLHGVAGDELPVQRDTDQRTQGLEDGQRQVAQMRLLETGLLDARLLEAPDVDTQAGHQRDFNLAMVELEARQFRKARDLLEKLFLDLPDDDRIALHLARVRRMDGDLEGARTLLERVVDHPDNRPYEQMQLAQLHLEAKEYDKALMFLFRAEQTQGDRPSVHSQIGVVYLAMNRWEDAERAFLKALERDDQHAESQRGLAETRLGQKQFQEAIAAALRAIDLDSGQPHAHYLLGAALLADGQAEIAAQVFETCLTLNPNHVEAHKKLAEACSLLGEHDAAGEHRETARKLRSMAMLGQQLRGYRRGR